MNVPINKDVEIRTAIFSDLPIIQDLANEIWPVAYNNILSKRQLTYMLELMYSNEALEKQMFLGGTFIIAEIDNEAVGFASFKDKENGVFKLDKLYVLPQLQNKGTGKQLLAEVIKRVLEVGGKEIQLQVNRKNNAVGFYTKMGFEIIRQEDFSIGNGFYMNDYIMSLRLKN